MKKKWKWNALIILLSSSIILTGFPVNLFIQHNSGETILESMALASDISEEIVDVPNDKEIEMLAEEKIETFSLEEEILQEELAEAFSDYESDEFDLQQMNAEQESILTTLITEEVDKLDLPTEEDRETYVQVMLDFYDSSSEVYQDIEASSKSLLEEIDENHSSPLDSITGEDVLAASHGWISRSLLASVTNTTITLIIAGAGFGTVWNFIKKKGVSYVRNYFKSRVKARIAAWFGAAVGVYAVYIWDFLMTVLDPGARFAKWLDARDKIRNNGWIELW
ncbi:hypothetical protein NGG16_02480 [Enterococcus casseliflavus]|uniref:hypothetical protein n=1 Tax=Enterococcus casseliflavus TaxID=37734 RepID=UPI002DBF2A0B|nr:hypothetical protein [Enterococcus casseliflavus]MEB8416300.1 hypothetical protein [Enterococcus casseliflavus]